MKKIKIESGKIVFMKRETAETVTFPDEITIDNLPPRTIVRIHLSPVKGSNINVEVWLPDPENWNGRFVGFGNGGSAGRINPVGMIGNFSKGCAVATTDVGTSPDEDSGIGNREVWKDFGFRATHLMTVTAKQVITQFYGHASAFSYFLGGSTGGQQALQEAQRYPEDYDGIVAMVPAHCRTPLHAYFLWNEQILQQCPFTETQENNIIAASNEYTAHREIPQTAGKMVSDPRCSAEDIAAVIQLARKKDRSLTQKHKEALRKMFIGPEHAITGERIFNGVPLGSLFTKATGHLYLFRWVFGAKKDLMSFNFGEDIDTYTSSLGPYLNAENPDLTPFEQRGGKLIMASGTADSVVPYHATLDYYERVIAHFGSMNKVKSFFKFYLLPGRDHGAGGPGINKQPGMFELIVNWREQGIDPGIIQGERVVEEQTVLTLPIYPYPMKTGWDPQKEYMPIAGRRGGVEQVAERFRPIAAE